MAPYIAPFAVYIAISLIASLFDNGTYYAYPIKTVAVAATLWFYRKEYAELLIKPSFASIILSVIVGIVVFVLWILPFLRLDVEE